MAIRLHKKEERPEPAMPQTDRPRVSKTHGFPRFVLWLLVAAIIVVGVYFGVTWNRLTVRGRVIAAYSDFIPEGRCRITTVKAGVAVGQPVKAGEVLLVTESLDPKSQIPAFEAALAQAKVRLDLVAKGGDVGVVDTATRARRLTDAREAADVAQARLEAAAKSEKEYEDLVKAIAADRTKEVEKANTDQKTGTEKLNQAKASEKEVAVELAAAKLNLDKAKGLKELDAATVTDVQTAQSKYDFFLATADKAASATQEAQASIDGIKKVLDAVTAKYDADLEAQKSRYARAQAETDVARAFQKHAQENLARAEAEYGDMKPDFKKMQADEIEFLTRQVEEAQGRLDYYKALAGAVEFKAPFNGIVSQLTKQAGDVADKLDTVISIYDPTTVAIEAYVPEANFQQLAKGQKAEVKIRGTSVAFQGDVVIVNTSPERLPGEMKATPAAAEAAYDRFITCRIAVPRDVQMKISPSMRADITIYVH
jgi:multidrug resistance efflux pump